jgi:curli biogenesis system outer membrane secretion channel CsgG
MFALKRLLRFALAGLLLAAAGCRTPDSSSRRHAPRRAQRTVKPVVAVAEFEDLSGFKGSWNLGEDIADLLVADLLDTERMTVLERKEIQDVVGDLVRQGQELFRKEGRTEKGRLKNAQYLVRGTITDFSETTKASGGFRAPVARIFGGGARARVAIAVTLSDVATGEIISSIKAEKRVSTDGSGSETKYRGVAFGGDAFFRTPFGQATEAVMAKTVARILRDLPVEYWQPRVAEGGADEVILNGGANVRVRVGDEFRVRDAGREVTDPVTGNVIERVPGKTVGRVRVTEVNPESAHAVVLEGAPERGQVLEPVR